MTTPEVPGGASHEYRTRDAGGELPLSTTDLARLASQIYAELSPLQVGAPNGSAPPAPRGSAPDGTAAAAAARRVAGPAEATPVGISDATLATPRSAGLPGPDSPPSFVPPAPRGSAAAPGPAGVPTIPPGPGYAELPAAPGGATAPVAPAAPGGAPPDAPAVTTAGEPTSTAAAGSAFPGQIAGAAAPVPASPPAVLTAAPRGSAAVPGHHELPAIPPGPTFADLSAGVPESGGLPSSAGAGTLVGVPPVWLDSAPIDLDLGRILGPSAGVVAPAHDPGRRRPGRDGSLDHHTSDVFDVASVRRDFPILAEEVNGHRLVWFDNAATTQKPRAVIDRLVTFYERENSNIHRAAHELAARATDAYEDARDTVRDFLGAGRSEEIVFVRGATEGINLVAQTWGRRNLSAGDEIVVTHLEHHANIVPWQMLAQQTGAVLKVAPVDDRGNLLLEGFTALLGPRTKLVAATQVANAIGTVAPVDVIVQQAHRVGARVLIDGAQSVPHLAVDLQQLGAEFFVFSGHKVFGPTGIGAVYIAERVWDETPAWHGGGNMIADVTIERSLYQGPPNKYEAGTGNIADAVGLGAALRYVREVGIERIAAYEHHLLDYATPRLAEVPGVRLIGTADHKASVLSFVLAGHEPEDVGKALNTRGIAVRAGHHCAQPILRRLGVEKTVRPSFAFYNTEAEIDLLVQTVRDISEGVLRA